MERKEHEFVSSPGMFRDFLEGGIWRDIKEELKAMEEGVKDTLVGADSDIEFRRGQGRAEVLSDIVTFIEGMPELIEDLRVDSSTKDEPED